MHPTIEIFGKTIGTYGLCAAAGLIAACTAATLLGKKKGYLAQDVLVIMLVCAAGMFIGGHILYGITQMNGIVSLFKEIDTISFIDFAKELAICFGGMVYYGGFLGVLAALAVYCHFSKTASFKSFIDIFAVCIPLFHVFGRIGCFFAGCCYGIESSWGFLITDNEINPSINGVVRLPIQLIEAACNLLIFLFLLFLYKKEKAKEKLIFIYMLIYPACRFILEFFRGDEIRGFIFGLSTSQFISIILFIVSIVHLLVQKKRYMMGS